MTSITLAQALNDAYTEEMERDASVMYMATISPPQLRSRFGTSRVRQAPIAESAMTGMAIGAAGSGYRPIVHLNCVTFSFVAFDQIANQAARIRYMFGGQRDFPLVLIAHYLTGSRTAAQHSQTGLAFYAHAGGLKILAPSSVADAKGLMKSAIRDNNPVVFVYAEQMLAQAGEVPDTEHLVPIGVANTIRSGDDVTIVGVGRMAQLATQAAEQLATDGISAEVIDPRTLVPLDIETIRRSVRRTGRLVIVDESFPTCSFATEIASAVVEDDETFGALTAPVKRICTAPIPVPYSPPLEDAMSPDVDKILSTVRGLIAPGAKRLEVSGHSV